MPFDPAEYARALLGGRCRAIDLAWLDRAFDLAERGRYGALAEPHGRRGRGRGADASSGRAHTAGPAGPTRRSPRCVGRAGPRAAPDLYLTLEPCVHAGAHAPCAPAVIASGVRRVDRRRDGPQPDRLGPRRARPCGGPESRSCSRPPSWRRRAAEAEREVLRAHGAAAARSCSPNGRRPSTVASPSASGESRWITGEAARRRAMLLREEYDAVLVGAGTVLADDPRLTRRLGNAGDRPHWRIVLDGRLRDPGDSARAARTRRPRRRDGGARRRTRRPAASRRAACDVWSLPGAERTAGSTCARLLAELGRHGVDERDGRGRGRDARGFLRARGSWTGSRCSSPPGSSEGERAPGARRRQGLPRSPTRRASPGCADRAHRRRSARHRPPRVDWTGRMFTGIVAGSAPWSRSRDAAAATADDRVRRRAAAAFARGARACAVSGVCLTAIAGGRRLVADLSPETLRRSTPGPSRRGRRRQPRARAALGRPPLRPLRHGARRRPGADPPRRSASGNSWTFTFSIPRGLGPFVVTKGSVALDGVSLTVAARRPGRRSTWR